MIAYEDLDRALARWKARAQGGVVVGVAEVSVDAVMETATDPAMDATPLPIASEELGSIPNLSVPGVERTGEIDVGELDAYEEDAEPGQK